MKATLIIWEKQDYHTFDFKDLDELKQKLNSKA